MMVKSISIDVISTTTLVLHIQVITCLSADDETYQYGEANQSSYEMFDHLFSFLRKHF
jgi:hypothetical protein